MAEAASLWRHRDFLKLWVGETISVFGSQFTGLALPLIAVLTLRATPGQMGLIQAFATAPFLLLGLIVGVWVDRRRRRPILIAADVGRGAVVGMVALLALGAVLSIEYLYVAALVNGLLTVFFDVAYMAYLPSLVERAQLVEANSKLQSTQAAAGVLGPGMAGAIIQLVGAARVMILDALSFFASAVALALVARREAPPKSTGQRSLLAEAREGLAVVTRNPLLRAIASCTGTFNFFSIAYGSVYVLYVLDVLHVDPLSLGLIFSLGSVGLLVGAVTAARLAKRFGLGLLLVPLAGFLPIAPLDWTLPVLVFAQALTGFSIPVYNVNQVSLRQAITPDHLQGRMNATMRFIVWGTLPLGALFGGALAELLVGAVGKAPALQLTLLVSAVGSSLAFLWVLFSPVRGLERIPEPAPPPSGGTS